MRPDPNRASPANARASKLVALARGVDRVPAHAGVVRSLETLNQVFMSQPPDAARVPTRALNCVLRSCARGALT